METLDAATLQAMLGPGLTAEQAALIFQQGQEAVVFALLTLAKQLAQKQAIAAAPDPSTPSDAPGPANSDTNPNNRTQDTEGERYRMSSGFTRE